VNGGTGPFTYLWSNNGTGSTISNIPGGSYTVTVTDSKGCSNTSVVNVNNSGGPTIAVSNTNVSCNGGNNGTATANPTGGTSPYTYSWSTSPVQNTQTANGLSAGNYTVTVTDGNGCTSFQTVTVTQPAPLAVSAGTDNAVCSGGNIIIGGSPTGPAGSTYSWSPGTGLSNPSSSNPTASPTSTTTYVVTVTDANGCTATDEVVVSVNVPPVVSFTVPDSVCRTHNGQIVYTGTSVSGTTYLWNFGGGTPVSSSSPGPHNVNWPTFGVKRVYVTVTNPGCPSVSDSQDVYIRNCETIIPNIFTPNGDGPNDKFYIVNIDKYPGSRIVIYNRWGLKIYESNSYLNDWDGRHYKTLSRLNDGVYYYILYRSDGEDFHGFVTLLRGEKF
jgi:gliding motility-associated-like protein